MQVSFSTVTHTGKIQTFAVDRISHIPYMQKPAVDRVHRQRISLTSINYRNGSVDGHFAQYRLGRQHRLIKLRQKSIDKALKKEKKKKGKEFGITSGSKDEDSGDATSSDTGSRSYKTFRAQPS